MNNKQRSLFLGAFLVSSIVCAQPIQLSSGDTLEVEIIRQTALTLTFSHPVLGRQTIDKENISNLAALDLTNIRVVTEGDEGVALDAAYAAEEKVVEVKQEFDLAKDKMQTANMAVAIATEDNLAIVTEEQVLASAGLKTAEDNLVTAVDDFNAAEESAVTANKVFFANEKMDAAKANAEAAAVQVGAAQQGLVNAELSVDRVEDLADSAVGTDLDEANTSIQFAENDIDMAEIQLDTAEEQLLLANEQVLVAENQVELAKGETVHDGFMGTGWFRDWDSSVEMGLNGASGSSEHVTFRTAFNTRYEDDNHRWDFKSFYLFDSADNAVNENRVNMTLVKDWFFKDTRWFAFAGVTYDWDNFKDWGHRLQISAGPGYQFIKTDEWEFSTRAGLTGIFEFDKTQYDSNGDERIDSDNNLITKNTTNLEAMIGADVTWHISAKQRFTASNYFYPSVTNGGEYRNVAIVAWVHEIEWFEGLALKFGIRDEYNTSESIPNEFKYNLSLLWGF